MNKELQTLEQKGAIEIRADGIPILVNWGDHPIGEGWGKLEDVLDILKIPHRLETNTLYRCENPTGIPGTFRRMSRMTYTARQLHMDIQSLAKIKGSEVYACVEREGYADKWFFDFPWVGEALNEYFKRSKKWIVQI